MNKILGKTILAVISSLGSKIGQFLLDIASFAKNAIKFLQYLADKKEKKEKIKREIKENNEIQDICNNGTLDDLLRKFNKISILALCLAMAGCQMSNEPIITTNDWEGHYKDETSFYKATRDIQLKKGESIWVLSNRTLSQLLINERKERK